MRITEMDTLFAYNRWANSRVLDAASGISTEEFVRADIVPIPHRNLRDTFVHMIDLERSARLRLSRNQSVEPLDPASFASIDELAQFWRVEMTAMNDYLSGLLDESMESEFSFNEGRRFPYWQLLMHVVNHSTQHRSEVAVLLTALGRSPGGLDLFRYLSGEAN